MRRIEGPEVLLHAQEAARHIALRTTLRPSIGLVLGSGWSQTAESLTPEAVLRYEEVPHFATPHVQGHAGRLVSGYLSGKPVIAFCGRPHLYEGYSLSAVAFPVMVLKEPLTHQAVLQVVEEATPRLRRFLEALAGAWPP